jgi:TonB-linked SusC/RagA family outer membrane protein
MKRLTFLLSLLVLGSVTLLAQVREISGRVTDQVSGEPLPGVAVLIKGTTVGTITGIDGNYTLSIPEDAQTLIFSYVGMKTVEENIEGRTTIDLAMVPDVLGLGDVIVTGYATQTRGSLTGSVSTVDADDLNRMPAINVVQRMQGQASGVTIQNSHIPGGDATIRVRGLGTINNNEPLFVIDGVPTTGGMTQINPNDIQSMTVLKDAASQSIYGVRAANGVIIITTKRGGGAKPSINFDARIGTTKATNKYDLLNTLEFGQLLWLEDDWEGVAHNNALYGTGAQPDIPVYILPARAPEGSPLVDPLLYNIDPSIGSLYLIMRANQEGTDWYEEMYQTAPLQEYNLSVTGGGPYTSYAISAGYMKEEGILLYTGFDRYSIRSNIDAKPTNWLKIGQSLGVSFTNSYGNNADNGEGTMISQGYRMQPIIPVYDIMGNWGGTKAPSTGNGANPVAELTRDRYDFRKRLRGIGNFFGEATIIPGLTFKSLFGYDLQYYESKDADIGDPEFSEAKLTTQLAMGHNYSITWNWQNILTYNKTFAGNHNLTVLAATEAVSYDYNSINANRSTFFSTMDEYMYLNAGEADQTNSGDRQQIRWMAILGNLNYDYAGKYLLQATIRHDGSSRFGANNRWGTFPAFSLGWRISEENFMSATSGWLNDFKIRGGWGQAGNDQIGAYNGFTTYRSNVSYSYYALTGSNTSTVAGFDSNAVGNPDAKWETTSTTNIGIDATFLNNRISLIFDLWKRGTEGMLFQVPVPQVQGIYTLPSVNIGDMENKGFDLQLIFRESALDGNLRFNIAANISRYKNEIIKLTDKETDFIQGGDYRQQRYTRAMIGTSFPEFYGFICDGIFETQAEVDAAPKAFGSTGDYNEPGHLIFRDVDGNGYVDDLDRTFIGSPHPDFTGGLNIDIGYKGFDLSAFFYTSYGNEIVNYVKRWIDYTQFLGNRSYDRLYKSWGSPYLEGEPTLAKADRDVRTERFCSHFIEDGSFLRLKTLQLSYTIPQSVAGRLGMNNMQVYVQGTNLFTLTKYSGLDPEVRNSSDTNMGMDAGAWPTSRQLMLGIRLGIL